MIDKMYSEYLPICDDCGAELEGYFDFQDAVDGMKANGWKIENVNGEWEHYCPECAAKRNRPGASEFAGVHAEGCACGTCGNGRPVPEDDTETRQKIMRYRQKHGLV